MSEHLRTAKIPCKEGVQKYRVHKCLFRKKEGVRAFLVSEYGNIQNAFTKEGEV